ncbi:NFACT family protein [Nicoliella spurrieriana]|uniref:Rqc2 homolog RqcH n=1 Tax=Nicoliella spurrieriana TaxID=2925830 RepID=A0A976X5H7_9LACO|nr:NFACT family protein [Nicoliella spurrieriana]UQS86597.1 NFACT family protein [Nicoliella spurrieriana]
MSFDGSFTHAMVTELSAQLTGGRISKINQPYPNEIIITIRSNRKSYPLLLSANPSYARAQVTAIPYVNPPVPTNFNMTLRKYLSGSVLTNITQSNNDRVIQFHFTVRNEIGDLKSMVLIIEIMARHSNVILVDGSDRRIIDAIKRIGPDKSRYRTILPGDEYVNPPKQDLIDPFQFNDWNQLSELVTTFPNRDVLAGSLQKTFQGLGRDTAAQLARFLHASNALDQQFKTFFNQFDHPVPTMIDAKKPIFLPFKPIGIDAPLKQYESLSLLLDHYYQTKAQRDRVREQGGVLIKVTKNELKKNRNKIKKLEQTLADTKHADDYRIRGEVLTTYLNQVHNGSTTIELPNFYDNNAPIKISLSPEKSPSQNAQWYFKQYQKKKNAIKFVHHQLDLTNADIDYFDNILSQIELAAPSNLVDIKAELQQGGYLRDHEHQNKKKALRQKISQPEQFKASDGTVILVGKNNLQNDRLTTKTADKRDTWLHTQKIHGSHVIIRSFDPSDQTITEAAILAAYFSKGRDSANVPVDYVQVRHVKKPHGAKPGFVIYEGQNTIYVTPTKAMVDQLRANNDQ